MVKDLVGGAFLRGCYRGVDFVNVYLSAKPW